MEPPSGPIEQQMPAQVSAGRTYRGPFTVMTVLFFMWGFMTVFNDILIPRFKEAFTLNYFQAMLVQLAFFGAYFIGALVYYLISATAGDPIARIGYKNGVAWRRAHPGIRAGKPGRSAGRSGRGLPYGCHGRPNEPSRARAAAEQ